MLTNDNYTDLQDKGYTVISDVIEPGECDRLIQQYRDWIAGLEGGEWFPNSFSSLVNTCNSAHCEPTWTARLKAKTVFAQLWKTDKLLTSFDAIAIGRPPEEGVEKFHTDGSHWLHVDQNASRVGLHAYQGAVYLEEQCIDDWNLHVMEGSHKHLQAFYDTHPCAAMDSGIANYYQLKKSEVPFFENKGCKVNRVPVPKGGMIVWDSRLIHANARPIEGRQHKGRWRFTVFVSMTPAIWASNEDLEKKKEAYDNALMSTHWSSQGVVTYVSRIDDRIECPKEVPNIATSKEAMLLSGAMPYDFEDGEPTGIDQKPIWNKTEESERKY